MDVEFFESDTGTCYVGDYIEELPPRAVKKIKRALGRLKQFGVYTLMSTTDFCIKLKGYDLYELRVLCEKVWYRIIFIIHNTTCWLLHLFIKKSNHTPQREINTALKRMGALNQRLAFS